MRAPWPEYWHAIARVVATRATCPRRSVGCVLVRDNRVLSTGYNGSPSGEPHCTDVGCDMQHGHCVRTVHAEANAIAQAARHGVSVEGATAFVTLEPCGRCAALLRSAGVEVSYWAERYA